MDTTTDRRRRREGVAAFALTIPLAKWLVDHVGTVCTPNGSRLVPVWLGVPGL